MKKTLISLAIAIVVLAGYVTGQAQLTNNPDVESRPTFDLVTSANRGSGSKSAIAPEGVIIDSKGGDSLDVVGNEPKGPTVVKTGSIDIRINKGSLKEKYAKVISIVPADGYVETSSTTMKSSTITIRVPQDKLNETLDQLRKLGTVTEETLVSSDRTYDEFDINSRLKILQDRKAALEKQLNQPGQTSQSYIQEQIFQLDSEIASLQGQKDLLDSQIAQSVLRVSLFEKGSLHDSNVDEDKEDRAILVEAWETSAGTLLVSFGGMMIVIAATLPFLIAGGIVFMLVRTAVRARRRKNVEESVSSEDN